MTPTEQVLATHQPSTLSTQPNHLITMTPTEIAQYAIIHISAEKIGMKEAAALFAMAFRPLTAKQVADAVDAEQRTITTRIQTLKRKGMIEAIHSVDGGVYYQLTDHGKTIIDGCIP